MGQSTLVAAYRRGFFESLSESSRQSAAVVVPLVIDLLQPQSVVDVGCGTGEWLAAFREHGVHDLLGVDGEWVPRNRLKIPAKQFSSWDLRGPLVLNRRFDLAICIEVGEHLPATTAETLVQSLVESAPAVLFSAAIPLQGGTKHINEQWPDYWAKLFEARGLLLVDAIRGRIWNNPGVQPYVAQNLFLYLQPGRLNRPGNLGGSIP